MLTADQVTVAGFYQIGWTTVVAPPLLSLGFTNDAMFSAFPGVITPFVFVLLILWGLAFLTAANRVREMRPLVAVFLLMKVAFTASWFVWLFGPYVPLAELWDQSRLAGLFFFAYGPSDTACAVFLAWVLVRTREPQSA